MPVFSIFSTTSSVPIERRFDMSQWARASLRDRQAGVCRLQQELTLTYTPRSRPKRPPSYPTQGATPGKSNDHQVLSPLV